MLFPDRKPLATSAVNPPDEVTPAAIAATLIKHTGHITALRKSNTSLPRLLRFRALPYHFVNMLPALPHSLAMFVRNQPQRDVVKFNQRSAIHFAQPVLQIRDRRIRHKQRPVNLQQRRPLDRLHRSPEVPVVSAQVAVPPPARPRLE